MPGQIPAEFIDSMLGRIDIVDIINSRVPLKKIGQNYQARCPFHNEKTPSFTVSPTKQFFYCFGCGAHGSAIGFLMNYERLNFYEAVADLAASVGMELPAADSGNVALHVDTERSYQVLADVDTWFRQQLRSHPQNQQAVTYLQGRGVSERVATEYGLGYAPPGWDNLIQALGKNETTLHQLIMQGMVVEQNGHYHDRFRNRIIFPIRDRRGRPIGFGGRVLDDSKPKYLNSPDTSLFHKGQELYGLFEARCNWKCGDTPRPHPQPLDKLLVVEGYMDVIALAQFGISYAVATLGTATTQHHLERLFKICQQVIFCFDGDQAGRDASWKAVNAVLPLAGDGRDIRFVFLPNGEDPDTMIRRHGKAIFDQALENAQPLSSVIFTRLLEPYIKTPNESLPLEARAKIGAEARSIINQLPAGIYRDMMSARLAQLTQLPIGKLGINRPSNRPVSVRHSTHNVLLPLIKRAVSILLQYPMFWAQAATIPQQWRDLQEPDVRLLAAIVDLLELHPSLSTAAIVERWRDQEEFAELQYLAHYNLELADGALAAEFCGALQRLNTGYLRQR